MRTILTTLLVVLVSGMLFVFPFASSEAQEIAMENAGFPDSNIWYSKDPFYAGEKIKVYTLVFNSSDTRLSGTVTFYAGETEIGDTSFSITPNADTETVSITWKAEKGKQVIRAAVTKAFIGVGENKQSVRLARSETGRDKRTITSPSSKEVATQNPAPLSVASSTVSNIKNGVPPEVASKASQGMSFLEEKRNQLHNFAETKKDTTNKEIERNSEKYNIQENQPKEKEKNPISFLSKKHSPFLQLKSWGLSALAWITNSSFVFYTVLFIIVGWIIKKLFRLIFRRNDY